jgi:hypothetical protein
MSDKEGEEKSMPLPGDLLSPKEGERLDVGITPSSARCEDETTQAILKDIKEILKMESDSRIIKRIEGCETFESYTISRLHYSVLVSLHLNLIAADKGEQDEQ